MPRDFFHGRHAGLLVPLFSLPSRESWGIGEIGDLPRLGAWMADAGFSFVQLLPINEMADGQNSPYSAMSAMAIDPIFISPASVPDIAVAGRRGAAAAGRARAARDGARSRRRSTTRAVRTVKLFALRAGFDHFREHEWKRDTNRALRLKAFIDRGALVDRRLRALPRAARAGAGARLAGVGRAAARSRAGRARGRARGARDRDPVSLLPAVARRQPVAAGARGLRHRRLRRLPVHGRAATAPTSGRGSRTSASTPRSARRRTRSPRRARTGASRPTAGTSIAAGGYEWLAARARRSAELYDGYRVDHLVGFFRTYVRESERGGGVRAAGRARSDRPGRGGAQRPQRPGVADHRRGSRRDPDVRARDARRGSRFPATRCCAGSGSGTRPGKPFKDPRNYPACSVATSGTHDTETDGGVVGRGADRGARRRWPRSITTARRIRIPRRRSTTTTRDAILQLLYRVRLRHRPAPDPGRVRMEGSDQHAGADQRRQLDVAAAVAGRRHGRRSRPRASAPRSPAGWRSGSGERSVNLSMPIRVESAICYFACLRARGRAAPRSSAAPGRRREAAAVDEEAGRGVDAGATSRARRRSSLPGSPARTARRSPRSCRPRPPRCGRWPASSRPGA